VCGGSSGGAPQLGVESQGEEKPGTNAMGRYGYESIPINTIFRGMNIHKYQLF